MRTRHYCTCGWTGATCDALRMEWRNCYACPSCHKWPTTTTPPANDGKATANWPHGSCGEYMEPTP